MVTRSVWRWISVVCVVFAGFRLGVAGAQAQDPRPQGQGPDADVVTQRQANLSGPDQIREGSRIIDSVSSTRRRISDQLDHARQERDIIKVNCLNDKLNQLDATLRSARDHLDLLQSAVSINNDGQRNHEFALMTIFHQRSDSLDADARRCTGEETGGFGNGTTVTVRQNPNIPDVDTTAYPVNPVVPERPVGLSPVL